MYFWGHFWLIVVMGEARFLTVSVNSSINEIFFLEHVGFIDQRIQAKN